MLITHLEHCIFIIFEAKTQQTHVTLDSRKVMLINPCHAERFYLLHYSPGFILLTLCILIDSSFWFDTTNLGYSNLVNCTYLGMSSYNKKNNIVFFSLNFTNSVDPDEMQR